MTVGGVPGGVGTLAMDSCSLGARERHRGSGWDRWAQCRVWVGSGLGQEGVTAGSESCQHRAGLGEEDREWSG